MESCWRPNNAQYPELLVNSAWAGVSPWSSSLDGSPLHHLSRGTRRSWSCAPESPAWSAGKRESHFRMPMTRKDKGARGPFFYVGEGERRRKLLTCFLNCWHSSGVSVSALAISGMTLTFSCRRFMNSMSRGFKLWPRKHKQLDISHMDWSGEKKCYSLNYWWHSSQIPTSNISA